MQRTLSWPQLPDRVWTNSCRECAGEQSAAGGCSLCADSGVQKARLLTCLPPSFPIKPLHHADGDKQLWVTLWEHAVFGLAVLPLLVCSLRSTDSFRNMSFHPRTKSRGSASASSWHCIRSPDSNVHVLVWWRGLKSCLSSQLSPEDYRDHAYTRVPEEVDIDVSWVLRPHVTLHYIVRDGSRLSVVSSSEQTEQAVWAGESGEDAGGETSAAVQREGD